MNTYSISKVEQQATAFNLLVCGVLFTSSALKKAAKIATKGLQNDQLDKKVSVK